MNGHFDIGGITPSRYFFPIAFVLGLLFALTSGEQDRPFALVLLQWQMQTLLPMALLVFSHVLLLRFSGFAAFNPWLALLFSGLVGASLFAPAALLIETWLEKETSAPFSWVVLLDEWLAVAPPVIVSWLALNAPWLLGYRLERTDGSADTQADESTKALPEFIELLPLASRGKPLLIKSELHYLRVVTDRGSGLVLYNLADALAALPERDGIQVHRSYWVAFDAIDSLQRRGRQGELVLHDGERVPVSRQRFQMVSEALDARLQNVVNSASNNEVFESSG